MSALPGIGISPAPSNERNIAARRLGDLLDTLIAIRMDVGHSANGIATSPMLEPKQMHGVRVLLDVTMGIRNRKPRSLGAQFGHERR